MNTLAQLEASAIARGLRFERERMVVTLADGREVSVPLDWYPRLMHATAEQRDRWELIGVGEGIHWPDLDEDLPVIGILLGLKPPASLAPKHRG
jgi:Protein of unknown function (DUF2442)